MSYYVVKAPERPKASSSLLSTVAGLLVLLSLFGGWAATRPALVKVDGQYLLVRPGTTILDLRRSGKINSMPGRLIAVDGRVLKPQGGAPPQMSRNGQISTPLQRVLPGDEVTSSPGPDRREPIVAINVAIPFETRYEGHGPLTELETLGAPGVKRVTIGALSGHEVSSSVVTRPSDMIVRRSRPGGKVVALTFDDGPWPHQTKKLLGVLENENVHVTFFALGRQARRLPDVVRQAVKDGNQIASHSYSHKNFTTLSAKGVRSEIERGREAVKSASGKSSRWVRPPYGAVDSQAWKQMRDLNVRAVLWDVDSRDWTKPGAKRIERNVLKAVKPGSVILFHDGGGDRSQTIAALPHIISQLRKRGYEFVTIDQMAALGKQVESRQ